MAEMNRRDLCATMTAFALLAGVAEAAPPAGAQAHGSGEAVLSGSRVFRFSEMEEKHSANGGWSRAVVHGTLPTGEFVECHQTMLPAGQMPHPPHHHRNTEFVLIREGTLEYLNNGKPEPAGPGDVVFTASDVMHGMKNVGSTPALYFVVSISRAATA